MRTTIDNIKIGDLINVEKHGYAYISDINYHDSSYGGVYLAKMLDSRLLNEIILFEDQYDKAWKLCENQ